MEIGGSLYNSGYENEKYVGETNPKISFICLHPHEFWAQTNLFDSKKGYEATLFQHLGNTCAIIHHQIGLPLNLGQIGGLKGSSVHE